MIRAERSWRFQQTAPLAGRDYKIYLSPTSKATTSIACGCLFVVIRSIINGEKQNRALSGSPYAFALISCERRGVFARVQGRASGSPSAHDEGVETLICHAGIGRRLLTPCAFLTSTFMVEASSPCRK